MLPPEHTEEFDIDPTGDRALRDGMKRIMLFLSTNSPGTAEAKISFDDIRYSMSLKQEGDKMSLVWRFENKDDPRRVLEGIPHEASDDPLTFITPLRP